EGRGGVVVDPEGAAMNAVKEEGEVERIDSDRGTETILDLRCGGIADGSHVTVVDDTVAIEVAIFDITGHYLRAAELPGGVGHVGLIDKEPVGYITILLRGGISDPKFPPLLVVVVIFIFGVLAHRIGEVRPRLHPE